MNKKKNKKNQGFSLLELMIAMTVTLLLMGMVSSLLARSFGSRARESRKTDALVSARAALNAISREVANSGYGLKATETNGIVATDSNGKRIHVRANLDNGDYTTNTKGEDVTYFFDSVSKSIVRYDPNTTPQTSVIVNRISDVNFLYYDYVNGGVATTGTTTPSNNTVRVEISVLVELEEATGQPSNQRVKFTTNVTLRNSKYMLDQY